MAVKPVPDVRPQWPPQVVQAMQNQLLLLFSSSDNATMAAQDRARSGTSSSSQLSYECTASHLEECLDLNETCAEASDKSWTSEVDSSSSILARERDRAGDAQDAGCTSSCDSEALQHLAAGDGAGRQIPGEGRIGSAAAPHAPHRTDGNSAGQDDEPTAGRFKRKGSPVTVHDHLWAELLGGRPSWSSRFGGSGILPRASGPHIELPSQPLPFGWEQFLDLKTGRVYYMNSETCERTCQDPRKRGQREDGSCSSASDHDEDSSSGTVVQSSSDYSYEDTLGSAQTEEASVMSS